MKKSAQEFPVEDYVTSNGARLWTTVSGDSEPALLLFNGGPGCDDYLAPVADIISHRVRVIRFEPRGCGRSDWDGRYTLDVLLKDAEAVRQHYGIDQWIVGGHSAGASYNLAYTISNPNRSLGFLSISGGNFTNDRSWSAAYHEGLDNVGEDNGGKIYHADDQVNPVGVASWRDYIKEAPVLRDLARIRVPGVFVYCTRDIRPGWPTRQLAELIPQARYAEIEGAAHYPWITHRDRLANALNEALDYILGTDALANDPD